EIVRAGDVVQSRGVNFLEMQRSAAHLEFIEPALALQPEINRDGRSGKPTVHHEERGAGLEAEHEVYARDTRRTLLPKVQPQLAFIFQCKAESNRGSGRLALIEPLIAGSIRIEVDLVSGLEQAMRVDQPGLSGSDYGDSTHSVCLR